MSPRSSSRRRPGSCWTTWPPGSGRADLYGPKLNRAFAELGAHYRGAAGPLAGGQTKDKARCERQVPFLRGAFWRGREFLTLAVMQTEAARWCVQVAGTRACRPLGGAAPKAVLDAVEAAALGALPARPFELALWCRPKVGPDIHIKVAQALNSVPWELIGHHVDVRATDRVVRVCADAKLVKTHVRATGKGKVTDYADYPPEKIAFHMRTPTWCRDTAAGIGPATPAVIGNCSRATPCTGCAPHKVCCAWPVPTARNGLRQPARAVAVTGYRTVKGTLIAGTETDPDPGARPGAPTRPPRTHRPPDPPAAPGDQRRDAHVDGHPDGDGYVDGQCPVEGRSRRRRDRDASAGRHLVRPQADRNLGH